MNRAVTVLRAIAVGIAGSIALVFADRAIGYAADAKPLATVTALLVAVLALVITIGLVTPPRSKPNPADDQPPIKSRPVPPWAAYNAAFGLLADGLAKSDTGDVADLDQTLTGLRAEVESSGLIDLTDPWQRFAFFYGATFGIEVRDYQDKDGALMVVIMLANAWLTEAERASIPALAPKPGPLPF